MNTQLKLAPLFLTLALAGVLVTPGCSKESKRANHLKRAEAHFQAGEYDRAEIEYLNVLRLDRTNQVALRHLGLMAFDQGRITRAFSLLSEAKNLDPEDFAVRVRLAQMLAVGGQPKEAREEALVLIARQPTNETALLLLVDSSATTNDVADAQQRLTALLRTDGENAGVHLALGMLHLRQRDPQAAEASVRKAIALNPQSPAAHMALGNLYLLQNDVTNAATALQTAAKLAPLRSPYALRLVDFTVASGDVPGARAQLEGMRKQTPDFLPALMRLAQLDLAERKFDECQATLKALLMREPTHLDALLLLARLRSAQNEPAKAVLELERALKAYPRVPQIHYQMALARLAQNDLPGAVQSLNETLALAPGLPEPTLLLAELDLRRGNALTAVNNLTRLVNQRPDLTAARLLLATAHRAANQPEAALKIYDDLTLRFPTNPQPAFLRGMVLGQQGRMTDARRSFEQALEFAPQFTAALEQLVNLDLAERKFGAAEQRVQQELARTPTNATPYLLLARVKLAQTNFDAAESALLKAQELAPESAAPNAMLARVYVQTGKQAAALQQLNEIVARNTNDLMTWMQIAELHSAATNHTAARDAYEKALAANPRYGPALNNLAYLYSEHLGDLTRAYELGSRARELMPNDPFTADTFGWILYRTKDYSRALALIQECLRAMPEQPEVLYHLGMTHYMMGEETAARLALQNAVQLGSADAFWRAEAAQRLELLQTDLAAADPATVREWESRLRTSPGDPVLLARLAAVAERAQDWPQAGRYYEQALQVNTNLVPAMVRLAQLYSRQLAKPDQAFALARRARTLEPNDPVIGHTLGRLAFDAAQTAADFQWAFGLLQESARRLPDDAAVQFDYARAAYALGQVSESSAILQKVIALSTNATLTAEARQWLDLDALLAKPSEATSAAARIAQVLQQQPDFVPALLVSALLQEQRQEFTAARDTYERVLKIFPLFVPVHKSLAELYAGPLKDPQKAYDQAVKARTAFPTDPQVARLLGNLAFQRNEFPRAAQLLKECAPAFPADAELLYSLGLAQYQLKQSRESKETLTQALALAPNSARAAEAKRILEELK